ncbi:MAG: alpha-amylase family glycosyl hydrolase [Luteolibacter sp.]
MKILRCLFAVPMTGFLLLLMTGIGLAALPNAWHIPDNSIVSGNGGSTPTMRNPRVEFGNTGNVRVFSGLQKLGNGFGTADQNGGTVFYKSKDQVAWNTVSLSFHQNTGNDQYWYADLNLANVTPNKVLQYYIGLTFNPGPADNAFVCGGGDLGGSQVTANNGTAAATPYTVRNRPAWVFHSNNRVINGTSVQFWSKLGYISDPNDATTKWADSGAVYYTTDGSIPGGALGIGTGTTQVALCSYDHPESNNQGGQSAAGTPMWWVATAPTLLDSLPIGSIIKYKIGFWHTDNNEEKFADYQAGTPNQIYTFNYGTLGDPVLTVNDVDGNYTTTHVFVDENANDSRPLAITFAPGQPDITNVEVFTNLNRRDFAQLDANGDGIEDGIKPPDGNNVTVGDNNYFTAYTMANAGGGNYTLTLDARKTGAYRLTARWKVQGDPAWRWFTNAGRRDHALVVSPVDSKNLSLYEMNVLNVESSDNTPNDSSDDFANRSTFEDLYNAPNAPHNGSNRWDLDYLKNLGCNWLWFQPIHPIGTEGQSFYPGSPYAVKNFFEVNPLMSVGNTRESAMLAFQGFVSAADNKGVGVMLDAPFNHTSPDAEISTAGVPLFGGTATGEIRNTEARFFSQSGNYGARASRAANIAIAPDRGDFGKWDDVRDVFFGNYSALVSLNPQDNGNYTNENDFFDFGGTNFDSVTRNVWKYFAEYPLFWLEKTGVPAGSDMATQTAKGIDGLRADFGQGLPPQLWEYIINKTRTRKWNFVFMSESLDGGAVTYRSNRHFDILNENIVFPLASASNPGDYRNIFDSRRNAYGQGLVLLNNTSHDEESYTDPFQALVRYSVVNTVDGAPLVFPGQELGISRTFGYQSYETNFGKQIAHFKKFNSMMPIWNDTNYGNDQLYPVYSGIGQARLFSKALRSLNRYYLDQTGGAGTHGKIFSVAKFETKNASPAVGDVVFAFADTDRDYTGVGTFNVSQDTDNNGVNDYGIKAGRYYNVKNIAAYTAIRSNRRDIWQWRVAPYDEADAPQPRLGSDILANGVYVSMSRVPLTNGDWSAAPFEAQYLKLYDVTPPPAPNPPAPDLALFGTVIGNEVTFTWSAASDPDGGVSGFYLQIGTTPGGADLFDAPTAGAGQSVTVPYGTTLYARVQQINNAGIYGPYSSASASVQALDAVADADGDGQSNGAETTAGTNPLSNASVLKATATGVSGSDVNVTVATVSGKSYQLETSTTLTSLSWTGIGSPVIATGPSTVFTHTAGAGDPKRFYRVRVVP